jgi:capsular polysaccharide export protein
MRSGPLIAPPPLSVLILQGPLGPFYGQIAGELAAGGAEVLRVNLSGNDVADWPRSAPGRVLDFDGRLEDWTAFLDAEIAPHYPDVVLMHGDRRPYHKVAAGWAAARGMDVVLTELGYLRPDWMVLERDGTSALSRFPADPDRIREIAAACSEVDFAPRWPGRTWPLMLGEVRFTLFNALGRRRFRHYLSHRSAPPSRVYSGWLSGRVRSLLRGGPGPVPHGQRFVFALQLEGDFQLRDHSPFDSVAETVEHVVASFAAHAPVEAWLVLKPHPHEFARTRLLEAIDAVRARHGLGDRLVVAEGHTITALCQGAAGFVTVNSSAGIEALEAGCPVHAVMPTIYDVAGLTHQGALDAFWSAAAPPDADLFEALRRAIAGTIQVRGTIYDPEGCRAAARAAAERILSRTVNMPNVNMPDLNTPGRNTPDINRSGAPLPSAHAESPPRLAKAAAMGVDYD